LNFGPTPILCNGDEGRNFELNYLKNGEINFPEIWPGCLRGKAGFFEIFSEFSNYHFFNYFRFSKKV